MLKKIFLYIGVFNIFLNAATHTVILENDFVTGTDKHYTNGFFYTWMGNEGEVPYFLRSDGSFKDNLAVSFSHLTFTPEDLSSTDIEYKDLPYAGYANLSFLLYKSTKNFFHEFTLGLGVVGPAAHSENFQKKIHKITGNVEPKGWHNQLKTKYMLNTSYQLGYKTDELKLGFLKFDWTNNFRMDYGKFYSGSLLGSSIRIGSHLPQNFKTSGNFIGGEESASLNISGAKGLQWSMALGVFINVIDEFYIVESYEKYNLADFYYTLGRVLSFNLYYEKFEFSFKIKSTKMETEEEYIRLDKDVVKAIENNSVNNWGGFTFRWRFD